jgi:hypothetical protein
MSKLTPIQELPGADFTRDIDDSTEVLLRQATPPDLPLQEETKA